jgi:hypothetical protein
MLAINKTLTAPPCSLPRGQAFPDERLKITENGHGLLKATDNGVREYETK